MSYVVPVKSKVEIWQNFVALSEYMNFTIISYSTDNQAISISHTKNTSAIQNNWKPYYSFKRNFWSLLSLFFLLQMSIVTSFSFFFFLGGRSRSGSICKVDPNLRSVEFYFSTFRWKRFWRSNLFAPMILQEIMLFQKEFYCKMFWLNGLATL